MRKKTEEAKLTQHGERFGHETGRHGSVRSKNQIDVSPSTHCVVLKQTRRSEGRFPSSLELPSWNRLHRDNCFGVKWVVVAPFELKIGPNKSYRRATSVKPPPGAKKAQIRAKIIVKFASGWAA